jgi:succinate dehydrogenase / fumarate reductase flavoprotein subunit
LYNMLELARVIVQGARARDESRGAHYKPDFPNRNDEQFLKTTKAAYVDGVPKITYEDVDTQWIVPRPRVYSST